MVPLRSSRWCWIFLYLFHPDFSIVNFTIVAGSSIYTRRAADIAILTERHLSATLYLIFFWHIVRPLASIVDEPEMKTTRATEYLVFTYVFKKLFGWMTAQAGYNRVDRSRLSKKIAILRIFVYEPPGYEARKSFGRSLCYFTPRMLLSMEYMVHTVIRTGRTRSTGFIGPVSAYVLS